MQQQLRTLTLPLAMLTGFLFSEFFARLNAWTPWLLFAMLFVTFCRIDITKAKFNIHHLWLLLIQIAGGIIIYLLTRGLGEAFAQGMLLCIFAPAAVASMVIVNILGGNLESIATYTLISNMVVALLAPLVFSFVGPYADMPFWDSFVTIISRVGPLLIVPLLLATALRFAVPRWHSALRDRQIISFYIWAFALVILTGRTVEFIKSSGGGNYRLEIYIAIGAAVACVGQFIAGRAIGRRYGDTIASGQSLGQKNNILAIWMAQTYLDPIASIGPASYVIWQNIVNSWQIWRKENRAKNGQAKAGIKE